MKNVTLNVLLWKNRDKTGTLRLEEESRPIGDYKVMGRGSRGSGDTSRLKKGNTPTGSYSGNHIVDTSKWPQDSFGPWGAIRLKPTSGNAMNNGRSGLLIHGGKSGAWGTGTLRPTWGCLRLSNGDMKDLVENIYRLSRDYEKKMSQPLNIKVEVKEW